ncbi:MAG: sigma-70 family RNA polymerase sigma factor [Candidatus Coatesbacteria bacterium]|nr:sigma-70 family RNA polymerase sigma factor [Candidatus Coatesbacteria bacterium]
MVKKSWEHEDIMKLKQGNPGMWKRFIDENNGMTYSLASSFSANDEEKKDLCMEIFSRAFENISSFREESKLTTWFYRLAYNHLLNFARGRKDTILSASDMEGDLENIACEDQSEPCEILDLQKRQDILKTALEKLPVRYKSALVLYYYEDRDYREIAEIMDIPLGTAKTILYRAKEQLRIELNPLLKEII